MLTTTISVIMPCYNSEGTILQAVQSVLAQTYSKFELIVVDDGSTDQSFSILTQVAQKDSRLKLFQNPKNLGLTVTLNRAIELASTDLLARLDSDDEMLPTRLEKQKNFMDENPAIAAVGSWYYFMGTTSKKDRLYKLPVTADEIEKQLLIENPLCHPSVLMRKSVLLKVGGYRKEFKNSEDYDLWLRFSKHYKLANIPEPLIRYRLSLGGLSLGRRQEMRLYHELAKASFLNPELLIENLKLQIEKSLDHTEITQYQKKFYWELSKTLFQLGWYQQVLKSLWAFFKAHFS